MDQILNTIERLRSRSEAERFRMLVVAVVVSVLVVGAIWGATLSYQLSGAGVIAKQDEQVGTELPGLGELFQKGGAAMTSSTKEVLRNFLLGNEKDEPMPSPKETESSRTIRLPEQ